MRCRGPMQPPSTTSGVLGELSLSGGLAGKLWTLRQRVVGDGIGRPRRDRRRHRQGDRHARGTRSRASSRSPAGHPLGFDRRGQGQRLHGERRRPQSGYTAVAPTTPAQPRRAALERSRLHHGELGSGHRAGPDGHSAASTSAARKSPSSPRKSQVSSFATVATGPRTDALAHHPSVLVVTVAVTITPTVPAVRTLADPTDAFTIVVDYGRIFAHGTFLAQAA